MESIAARKSAIQPKDCQVENAHMPQGLSILKHSVVGTESGKLNYEEENKKLLRTSESCVRVRHQHESKARHNVGEGFIG